MANTRTQETRPAESRTPTPWAVHCLGTATPPEAGPCNNGDIIYINRAAYMAELMRPDSVWKCPRCRGHAEWDDVNYEARRG